MGHASRNIPSSSLIIDAKAARDRFGFKSGDRLIMVSDENGIALLPTDFIERMMNTRTDKASD